MFERIEIIRRLLGTLVVTIGSLGCTLQLYRFSRGKTRPMPVITIYFVSACHPPFGCVAGFTGLAVADLVAR